jgi:hypothetical protein
MSDRARYVVAGAIMAVLGSSVFDLIDKDWRYAAWLVLGFVAGAIWWKCVGRDWDEIGKVGE